MSKLFVSILLSLSLFIHASPPTGHRFVRSQLDFDHYVVSEPLPTLLLIHSSNPEECKSDCAKLYSSFLAVALETKGYIRFSSLDVGTAEGSKLVKERLQLKEEPPIMMAFRDMPNPTSGRPAMMFSQLDRIDHAQLKRTASDLLPKDVHRSVNVSEFDKHRMQVLASNRPLVALVAPKLTTSAMVKAMWALLRPFANLTLVDTNTENGKAIQILLGLDSNAEVTQVVGFEISLGQVNATLLTVTPDTVLEFARTALKSAPAPKKMKETPLPPGVLSNVTQLEWEAMLNNSLPVISVFTQETNRTTAIALYTSLLNEQGGKEVYAQFGISTMLILCGDGTLLKGCTTATKSYYVGKNAAPTYPDAIAQSKLVLNKMNLPALNVVTGQSIHDFFAVASAQWKDQSQWDMNKLFFVYIGEDASPSYIQSASYVLRSFADFVHLTKPYDEDTLRSLHLDPSNIPDPAFIAYVPNLAKEREDAKKEEEEMAEFTKEENKKKKKNRQAAQKSNRGVSFHIIPATTKLKPEVLTFELIVDFCMTMLQSLDAKRLERVALNELEFSGMPHLVWSRYKSHYMKQKLNDGTLLPNAVAVNSIDALNAACDDKFTCAVFFHATGEEKQAMEVAMQTKMELERTDSSYNVRIVLVDGNCHFRVANALHADPSMLPTVAVWMRRTGTVSLLRGQFNSGAIAELIQQAKRGKAAGGMLKVTSGEVQFESECFDQTTAQGGEEEDDLIKEMRLEAEREEIAKEKAKADSIVEAKRLKAERDAELKAMKNKMNAKESERAKKRTEL